MVRRIRYQLLQLPAQTALSLRRLLTCKEGQSGLKAQIHLPLISVPHHQPSGHPFPLNLQHHQYHRPLLPHILPGNSLILPDVKQGTPHDVFVFEEHH